MNEHLIMIFRNHRLYFLDTGRYKLTRAGKHTIFFSDPGEKELDCIEDIIWEEIVRLFNKAEITSRRKLR